MKVIKTRTIDSHGRVTIPQEVRDMLDIKTGDLVYFEVSKAEAIIIRKFNPKTDKE